MLGGPDPGHVLPLNLPSDDNLSEPSSKFEAECNPAYISIGIVDSAPRRIPWPSVPDSVAFLHHASSSKRFGLTPLFATGLPGVLAWVPTTNSDTLFAPTGFHELELCHGAPRWSSATERQIRDPCLVASQPNHKYCRFEPFPEGLSISAN